MTYSQGTSRFSTGGGLSGNSPPRAKFASNPSGVTESRELWASQVTQSTASTALWVRTGSQLPISFPCHYCWCQESRELKFKSFRDFCKHQWWVGYPALVLLTSFSKSFFVCLFVLQESFDLQRELECLGWLKCEVFQNPSALETTIPGVEMSRINVNQV